MSSVGKTARAFYSLGTAVSMKDIGMRTNETAEDDIFKAMVQYMMENGKMTSSTEMESRSIQFNIVMVRNMVIVMKVSTEME